MLPGTGDASLSGSGKENEKTMTKNETTVQETAKQDGAVATVGRSRRGSPFKSEAAFRRGLEKYVAYCAEKKRVPNAAGFCSYCGIMRKDFAALEERFPLQFDIAQSTFLDEALNTKAANTGAMLEFLMTLCRGHEEPAGGGLQVVCDHDAVEDGF